MKKEEGLFKCSNDACKGTGRCNLVCETHFWEIVRDNKRRVENEIPIPDNFDLIIKPSPLSRWICKIKIDTYPVKENIDEIVDESELGLLEILPEDAEFEIPFELEIAEKFIKVNLPKDL